MDNEDLVSALNRIAVALESIEVQIMGGGALLQRIANDLTLVVDRDAAVRKARMFQKLVDIAPKLVEMLVARARSKAG